jgi:hypothetical protein
MLARLLFPPTEHVQSTNLRQFMRSQIIPRMRGFRDAERNKALVLHILENVLRVERKPMPLVSFHHAETTTIRDYPRHPPIASMLPKANRSF